MMAARCLAAFAVFTALLQPTLAQQSGGCPKILPDKEFYTQGQYGAYASPWSTLPDHENEHYVRGVDYSDEICLRPSTFPDNTVITTRWPSQVSNRVLGYMHVTYGNYDSGVPKAPVTPLRVRELTTFTETLAYRLQGATDYTSILGEFYLTKRAGKPKEKAFEIGILYQASRTVAPFLGQAKPVGTFTDPQKRSWSVSNAGPNAAGAVYIIFQPTKPGDVSGVIDRKAMLDYLLAQRVITDDLWINGIALGIEPHGGKSIFHIDEWLVVLN